MESPSASAESRRGVNARVVPPTSHACPENAHFDRDDARRSRAGRARGRGVTGQGIGARLARKEDERYLRGRGQFVGDMSLPHMCEVAFLRSPVAPARIKAIRVPPALRERVFIAQDLAGVPAIRADTALPGFKSSLQPILATDKVRHVGEPIAMCVAPSLAQAEDLVAMIEVEFEALPVVNDMLAGRAAGAPPVHEQWGDNLFLTTRIDVDFAPPNATAAHAVT